MLHLSSFSVNFTGAIHYCKKPKTIEKSNKSCVGFPTISNAATKSLHQPLKGVDVHCGSMCAPTQVSQILCAVYSQHSEALKAERIAFKAVFDFCLLT